MNMRVITAIIGIPVLLACCYLGSWLMVALCCLLAALAILELTKLFAAKNIIINPVLAIFTVLLTVIGLGVANWKPWPAIVAVLVVAIAYAAYTQWQDTPLALGLAQFAAVLYIGIGFGALLLLRLGYNGWQLVLLAFLNVWLTDIAAYEVGRRIGRHKLAPVISPHKTIEGAVAGLICATVICGFYMFLILHIHLITALGWALIFSFLAQIGDLAESALKRWAGVKDSGSLLPGHGGVLDRFDSLLLSAPCIAILLSSVLL